MNKKAQIGPMQIIILFVILAVVAAVILWAFNNFFGQETEIIGGQIGGLNVDSDGDGLVDTIDPCPCDPAEAPNCNKQRTCLP